MKNILVTGIKPTGTPHLGNYLGAIKPAVELSKNSNDNCYYFVADYHALNFIQNAELLKKYTKEVACTWLACGLDPKKVLFYRQSDIPETFELTWILNNVTPKGLMNRAHAYKAIVEQNILDKCDEDANVNMGLYNYPILMTADILLFNANLVPVGQDQKQHVEIARDIAENFNRKYGDTLIVPAPLIKKDTSTVNGFDGRKMSKSYNNTIPLFCEEEVLRKYIMKIVTDSTPPDAPKTTDCTIFQLYSNFADEKNTQTFKEKLIKGISWGEAKKELFELINNYLKPMREKYNYYITHFDEVEKMLLDGSKKARLIADETIKRVRASIGV